MGLRMMSMFVGAAAFLGSPSAAQETASGDPGMGKIVIYRPQTIVGAAVACPVRYRQRELVELGRGKFAEWPVAPGRYILTNKTSSIEVHVSPGETRYVRCSMKMGILLYRADLQIVDAEAFEPVRTDFEQKSIAAE